MLADIVKRANHPVAARHNEDTLFEDPMRHEATGIVQLIDMRDQVPGFEEDLGLLLFEHRGVVEETCRQRVTRFLVLDAPTRFFDGHMSSLRFSNANYGAFAGFAC